MRDDSNPIGWTVEQIRSLGSGWRHHHAQEAEEKEMTDHIKQFDIEIGGDVGERSLR